MLYVFLKIKGPKSGLLSLSNLLFLEFYNYFKYAKRETLAGERIRVITIDHEPFVDISIDEATGQKVYEGMCAELIQSRHINFAQN